MIVVYHARCRDGFAAAWAIRSVYPDAKFIPANYGEPIPGFPFAGEDVIFADFCLSRMEMERIAYVSKSLAVYDHHKTAEEALRDFPTNDRVRVVFDMERSGAGIAWDELHAPGVCCGPSPADVCPSHRRPWFISYVEDRDLWRFNLANSKQINAYLASVKFDFEDWDHLQRVYPSSAAQWGALLVQKTEAYVEEVGKNSYSRVFPFPRSEANTGAVPWVYQERDVHCRVVNAPQVDISEVLAGLLEKFPCHMAAGWWLRSDGIYQVGLRSRASEDVDVSAMAKYFGGGGHRNAAGFQCKTLPSWVLPS